MPFLRFALIQGHIATQLDKYGFFSENEIEEIFIKSLFEVYNFLEKKNQNYNLFSSKEIRIILEKKYVELKELNELISKHKFC